MWFVVLVRIQWAHFRQKGLLRRRWAGFWHLARPPGRPGSSVLARASAALFPPGAAMSASSRHDATASSRRAPTVSRPVSYRCTPLVPPFLLFVFLYTHPPSFLLPFPFLLNRTPPLGAGVASPHTPPRYDVVDCIVEHNIGRNIIHPLRIQWPCSTMTVVCEERPVRIEHCLQGRS